MAVVTLVREAAVRCRYGRGRSLGEVAKRFTGVASTRAVQRWLAEVRPRAPAVLNPLSEAILALFPGVDPTVLLPVAATRTLARR